MHSSQSGHRPVQEPSFYRSAVLHSCAGEMHCRHVKCSQASTHRALYRGLRDFHGLLDPWDERSACRKAAPLRLPAPQLCRNHLLWATKTFARSQQPSTENTEPANSSRKGTMALRLRDLVGSSTGSGCSCDSSRNLNTIYININVRVYAYTCIYTYVYMYTCMYVCMFVCMYVCIPRYHTYAYTEIIYTYRIFMHLSIYIYTFCKCSYTYLHIHTCMHTYMHAIGRVFRTQVSAVRSSARLGGAGAGVCGWHIS